MGIKQLYNDNLRKLPNEYGDVSVMTYFIKKSHSWQTLASMIFVKRSGTYNLYCFGKVGYKNDVKTANKYGNTCFFFFFFVVVVVFFYARI